MIKQCGVLLARYGFDVARDEDLAALDAELSAELGRATKVVRTSASQLRMLRPRTAQFGKML